MNFYTVSVEVYHKEADTSSDQQTVIMCNEEDLNSAAVRWITNLCHTTKDSGWEPVGPIYSSDMFYAKYDRTTGELEKVVGGSKLRILEEEWKVAS